MLNRIVFVFALLGAVAGLRAGTVSGRVFIDTNGNGRPDAGEPGMANCVVSDERTLVRTDAQGRYQMALPAGAATVYVVNAPGTWPAGKWWAAVDGKQGGTVDFALRSELQMEPFYFVHGSDTHVTAEALPLYRRYVEHVNGLGVPVKFVVHTGDLIMDGLMRAPAEVKKQFELYQEANRGLKPELRNVLGNHDLAGVTNPRVSEREAGYGKAMFRATIGPVNYAWRLGQYHFLALDGSTVEGRTVSSGLTKESADWAISYLKDVGTNEPVILTVHQPMIPEADGMWLAYDPKQRPHEARLLAVLRGKLHLATLAGHVHSRTSMRWGRAAHLTPGAVSYAWHGLRPYPPNPMGYTLFKMQTNRMERVALDWAEQRSVDVRVPEFTDMLFGNDHSVIGSVSDLRNEITGVEVSLGGVRSAARIAPLTSISKQFSGGVVLSNLVSGVHDLMITAKSATQSWTETIPTVVYTTREMPFKATGKAKLSFRVDGEVPGTNRVIVNSRLVGKLEPGNYDKKVVTFEIPAERLRRLNEIRIHFNAPDSGPVTYVSGLGLEYGGRQWRDVRYSPLARRAMLPERFTGPSLLSAYVDLVYEDRAPVGK